MHFIQKLILDRLTQAAALKYSDLQPAEIMSSHFSYHLQQLIKEGLVQKSNEAYELTPVGKKFVDKLSVGKHRPHILPKGITYLLIEATGTKKILLYQKQREPYLGLWQLPGGKHHEGETRTQASLREFHEKITPSLNPKLTHVGSAFIMIHEHKKLISHVLANVYKTTLNPNTLELPNYYQWFAQNDLIGEARLLPDLLPLLKLCKSETFFFEEVTL